MERPDVEAILERCEAATPGPWRWGGSRRGPMYLMGKSTTYVMGFIRQGMNGAQPMFQHFFDRSDPRGVWYWTGKMMRGSELAIQEVSYRDDIVGFNNPDATLIASCRQDLEDLARYALDLEQRLAHYEQADTVEAASAV